MGRGERCATAPYGAEALKHKLQAPLSPSHAPANRRHSCRVSARLRNHTGGAPRGRDASGRAPRSADDADDRCTERGAGHHSERDGHRAGGGAGRVLGAATAAAGVLATKVGPENPCYISHDRSNLLTSGSRPLPFQRFQRISRQPLISTGPRITSQSLPRRGGAATPGGQPQGRSLIKDLIGGFVASAASVVVPMARFAPPALRAHALAGHRLA